MSFSLRRRLLLTTVVLGVGTIAASADIRRRAVVANRHQDVMASELSTKVEKEALAKETRLPVETPGRAYEGAHVYLLEDDGLQVSNNRGRSFTKVHLVDGLSARLIDVTATAEKVYVLASDGLWVSDDFGGSFIKRHHDATRPFKGLKGLAVEGRTVLAFSATQLYLSQDGGRSFTMLDKLFGSEGMLMNDFVQDVIVADEVIYVAFTSSGLMLSYDGGLSFEARMAESGLSNDFVVRLAKDRQRGLVWVRSAAGDFYTRDSGVSFHQAAS